MCMSRKYTVTGVDTMYGNGQNSQQDHPVNRQQATFFFVGPQHHAFASTSYYLFPCGVRVRVSTAAATTHSCEPATWVCYGEYCSHDSRNRSFPTMDKHRLQSTSHIRSREVVRGSKTVDHCLRRQRAPIVYPAPTGCAVYDWGIWGWFVSWSSDSCNDGTGTNTWRTNAMSVKYFGGSVTPRYYSHTQHGGWVSQIGKQSMAFPSLARSCDRW